MSEYDLDKLCALKRIATALEKNNELLTQILLGIGDAMEKKKLVK